MLPPMATVRPCSLSVDEYLAAGRRERSAWVHRGFISGTIWTMSKIRLRSAEAPFDHRRVVGEAARLLCRAEASGIWDPPALVTRLDGQLFGSALDDIAECGVATTRRLEWSTYAEKGSDDFADWIHGVRSELEDCPVPQRELPKLVDALGSDLRDRLGVSPSALQRYRDESRDTPDDVAWRAHVLDGDRWGLGRFVQRARYSRLVQAPAAPARRPYAGRHPVGEVGSAVCRRCGSEETGRIARRLSVHDQLRGL